MSESLVIYEAHVKGLTQTCPDVREDYRGKFLGVCSPFIMDHIKRIGCNTIQLMPVMKSTHSYWGYCADSWFEVNSEYGTMSEFEYMVKTLQSNGIKVILDVVYNHVHHKFENEFKEMGVKFFDNDSATGCGNCVDVNNSLDVIIPSISWWLDVCGVDGLRFDLAPVLGREKGNGWSFNKDCQFFKETSHWIDNSGKVFIAEPWDCNQYCLGMFPDNWLELNGNFRDVVQSGDVCWDLKIPSERSVNFLFSHDGATMQDFVSYHNIPKAYNHGVNGDTDDEAILKERQSHKDWMWEQLWLSEGHKLVRMGDEMSNTQLGDTNPYNVDSEITWLNW